MANKYKIDCIKAWEELNECLNTLDDLPKNEIIKLIPTIKKRISDAHYYVGRNLKESDLNDM